MDNMPMYLVFFQSLPENMLLISLGLGLTGTKPILRNIFVISLTTSLASYIIRSQHLPPGVNVIAQLPVLILSTAIVYKLKMRYSAIVSFLGLICLFLVETPLNFILLGILGLNFQQVLASPRLRLAFPLPEFVILAIIIFIVCRKGIVLFDIQELRELEYLNEHKD